MKLLITSALMTGFMLVSCKKESQNTATGTDTITMPDTTSAMPSPALVDTLVAAPKSDTVSMKTDSTGMVK